MSASEPAGGRRVISGAAVADFSHLTSPEDLVAGLQRRLRHPDGHQHAAGALGGMTGAAAWR